MTEFNLYITPESEKDINKLNSEVKNRIRDKLEKIYLNPLKEGKLLSNLPERWKKLRSARVGNYRILYKIEKNDIVIHAVKHRSVSYDFIYKR